METPFDAPRTMTAEEIHDWQEERLRDTWRVFRIMSEFVEGFETMGRIGPSVSVFGSARTRPGTPEYELGEAVGRALAAAGYATITGAGPGLMEAANKGAREAGGVSAGLGIALPHEQGINAYVDHDRKVNFEFFFARKTMFVKYAMGYIVLPGGFGTLDELFEALTLIQTGKAPLFPIVLMGTSFWTGLIDWLRDHVLAMANISDTDFDLFYMTDSPEEAVAYIDAFCREHGHRVNLPG